MGHPRRSTPDPLSGGADAPVPVRLVDSTAISATRTFYRIVRTNPPTLGDFMSHAALGIPSRRRDSEAVRLRRGISVYATEAQARRKARGVRTLGDYLARLEIPVSGPIVYERTTESSGHHTLWGDPAAIMGCVVSVVPV